VNPRRGLSRTTTAVSVVVIAVLALTSVYLAFPSSGKSQATSSSNGNATFPPSSGAGLPTFSSSSPTVGTLIGVFNPAVPIISQYMPINYTLYFSEVGYVPSPLNISLSSPVPIKMSVYPSQITVPGLTVYVNTTVVLQPAASLPLGTYPVNVKMTHGSVVYNETLDVKVIGEIVVTLGTHYVPQSLTVPVNTTVTWLRLNEGGTNGLGHTEGDLGIMDVDFPSLNFSSKQMLQFQYVTYTFTVPGTYNYHCDYHPAIMNAVVTVTPAAHLTREG